MPDEGAEPAAPRERRRAASSPAGSSKETEATQLQERNWAPRLLMFIRQAQMYFNLTQLLGEQCIMVQLNPTGGHTDLSNGLYYS